MVDNRKQKDTTHIYCLVVPEAADFKSEHFVMIGEIYKPQIALVSDQTNFIVEQEEYDPNNKQWMCLSV